VYRALHANRIIRLCVRVIRKYYASRFWVLIVNKEAEMVGRVWYGKLNPSHLRQWGLHGQFGEEL